MTTGISAFTAPVAKAAGAITALMAKHSNSSGGTVAAVVVVVVVVAAGVAVGVVVEVVVVVVVLVVVVVVEEVEEVEVDAKAEVHCCFAGRPDVSRCFGHVLGLGGAIVTMPPLATSIWGLGAWEVRTNYVGISVGLCWMSWGWGRGHKNVLLRFQFGCRRLLGFPN